MGLFVPDGGKLFGVVLLHDERREKKGEMSARSYVYKCGECYASGNAILATRNEISYDTTHA